jgi:hypothetical protein
MTDSDHSPLGPARPRPQSSVRTRFAEARSL